MITLAVDFVQQGLKSSSNLIGSFEGKDLSLSLANQRVCAKHISIKCTIIEGRYSV